MHRVRGGTTAPGESVTLMPGNLNAFCSEGGDVLIGKVSTVEENEPPAHLLVGGYRDVLLAGERRIQMNERRRIRACGPL